ncbi:MAG: hypothetical protein GAS50_04065 [Desulfobacterales bacterium]|nr:hypothetical protein [Desulfobacterales bacterium]
MSERKPCFFSTHILINIFLVCAFLFFNLIVQTPMAGADDAGLSVDFRDNLVSIHANDVNFKEVLRTLKSKTGVNVVIFQEVPDHKVSLNIQSLPLYALDTIIKKMALKNSAVVYDDALQMMSVYVLPEGLDISKVVSGGTIIRSADFAVEKEVSTIKGKNKLPIRYVKDELLIKFHLGVTEKEINSILQEYGLQRIPNAALLKIGYVKVRVPKDKDVIEMAKAIRKDYRVKVPDPNYIANIFKVGKTVK